MSAAGAMKTRESAEPNSMIGIRTAAAQQGLISGAERCLWMDAG